MTSVWKAGFSSSSLDGSDATVLYDIFLSHPILLSKTRSLDASRYLRSNHRPQQRSGISAALDQFGWV